MLSPEEGYPLVQAWLLAMDLVGHRTAVAAVAHLVTALLLGQSLWTASLMRVVGSRLPVPARQRYRRVARAWTPPWLTPGWLMPGWSGRRWRWQRRRQAVRCCPSGHRARCG